LELKKSLKSSIKERLLDYPDFRLDKKGSWIRLRHEGDEITLAFKQRLGIGKDNDEGMEEIEFVVSDFEQAEHFLLSIGLIRKGYQENKRIRYQLGNIEFDIDLWPKLNPYLEIEAPSWKEIDKAIVLLGLNPEEKRIFSTNQIYELEGINLNEYIKVTFNK